MNSEKYESFTAGINDSGRRADRIIRQFLPEKALSGLYKAFRKGLIRLNGKKTSPESKVMEGDTIEIYKSLLSDKVEKKKPSSVKVPLIFENDDLLALCKPKGQLVHGSDDSLEKQVKAYLSDKLPFSMSFKPGPLHRLDRNTSGLIFFSKSLKGANEFSRHLRDGGFTKYYVALVDGMLKRKEVWVDNLQRNGEKRVSSVGIEGSRAHTTFIPIRSESRCTLVLAIIETGRTHQIRAQAAHHGFPLRGDRKYGGSSFKGGYILHSLAIKSNDEPFRKILGSIRADLSDSDLKRLNGIFRDRTKEELKSDILKILEDQ